MCNEELSSLAHATMILTKYILFCWVFLYIDMVDIDILVTGFGSIQLNID